MRDWVGFSGGWAAVLTLFSIFVFPAFNLAASELVDKRRQQELAYLLKHDCGSCHGMKLKGGLGPPLLPEALAGKPPIYLKQVISKGMPGSAMPPWEKLLSEADIDYLVSLLIRQTETQPEVSE